MSFLTPLYLLGALAVVAPIVFHLIRRSPTGGVPFSSLMFLAPTPPRLTRRSRLDHWFLLLLRAAALMLLAAAFMRPFLRNEVTADPVGGPGRRVAVLVDTSASLRRGDLWPRAKVLADAALAACRPGDQVALFAFDGHTRPLLSFGESATLDPTKRLAVARGHLARLEPTWGATDLGQALVDVVGAVDDAGESGAKSPSLSRRIVLVSDLQQGSRLDALGDFEWPSDVRLELATVTDPNANTGLQSLPDDPAAADPGPTGAALRVRVSNEPSSRKEAFTLRWQDEAGKPSGEPIPVYVPPGESRVLRVPLAVAKGAPPRRVLRLEGDAQSFDNTLYVAATVRDDATVLFVGDDAADDPSGLLYYLKRVFEDVPRRAVKVETRAPTGALAWQAGRSRPLVVLDAATSPENLRGLRDFMTAGGTLLLVLTEKAKQADTLAVLAGVDATTVTEAEGNRDALIGEVAFDHPLFAPLAGPQFNDFTKIHFWKHRKFNADAIGPVRVAARFENGDPAVAEKAVGKGRLVVFASGWAPGDSQLARSSKFVPLTAALLDADDATAGANGGASYLVNDRVPVPGAGDAPAGIEVRKPDGSTVRTETGTGLFTSADVPGVYTILSPDGPRPFAVNLDPAEGRTSPLQVETLEQFGCRLVTPAKEAAEATDRRQLQSLELENRQKLWRWLILTALAVLVVETWLSGRLGRTRMARAEALAT